MTEVRQGVALLLQGDDAHPLEVLLTLRQDQLTIQKEELVYVHSPTETIDPTILVKERMITVRRENVGGLGLSVKGGAEHNLPVLISRIFKDQAADKTGQLYVGDAILKVNNEDIENCRHDDAVTILKNAGEQVTLVVKYFKPASLFLSRNKRYTADEQNNTEVEEAPKLEKQWADVVTVPLLGGFLTQYIPGTDKLRTNTFEVVAYDGTSSGVIQVDDAHCLQDWVQYINNNINALNSQSVIMSNKVLLPSQHIVHMCWVSEHTPSPRQWQLWKPHFLALKGQDVYLFDTPPIKGRDWTKYDCAEKVYECLFKEVRDGELIDNRQHCFVVETGRGDSWYMSLETRQDLLRLEKAWYRANYIAVSHLKVRTFGCTWRSKLCGLTLDMQSGFSLYDSETKSFQWSYRFSQLKSSSDDNKSRLNLCFLNDSSNQLETKEIECTNLRTLLYSMHAFLSAKLASVDPHFFNNL